MAGLTRNGSVQPVEGVSGGIPIPVTPNTNRTDFKTGQQNVAVAGTANQLPSQVVPDGFTIAVIAKKTNTKNIYLSDSQANAQNHTVADILAPGDVRKLQLTNWNIEWVDADVSGEGVTILSEV